MKLKWRIYYNPLHNCGFEELCAIQRSYNGKIRWLEFGPDYLEVIGDEDAFMDNPIHILRKKVLFVKRIECENINLQKAKAFKAWIQNLVLRVVTFIIFGIYLLIAMLSWKVSPF